MNLLISTSLLLFMLTANRSIASPSMRKVAAGGSLANNSVTGVVFQQQHTLISSGASDG